MASIRKRGDSWLCEVRRKGIFKSATFPTKTHAQTWATKIEADILAGKTGSIPNKTFGDLLTYYAENISVKKKGERWEVVRINKFLRNDIAKVKLADLSATDFVKWRDRSLETLAGSSVKRERNLLSNVLTIAVNELKWLHDNPLRGVKMPKSNRARDRLILEDELEKLKFVLNYDKDKKPVTINARIGVALLFAIETGMRIGEICALQWKEVFLAKKYCKVAGIEVGAGKTESAQRDVPLSPEAIRLLNQMGTDGGRVFDLKSSQVDSNFRKAKAQAGIEDLHFHDSRANACTKLSKKIDILSLARMLGHKNLSQLQVYYRETAEDTAAKL
jgi:integrase